MFSGTARPPATVTSLVAALIVVIFSTAGLQAQQRMQSGEWEVLTTGDVEHSEKRCVGAAEADEVNGGIENVRVALQKKAAVAGCNAVNLKVQGNTISYDTSCGSMIVSFNTMTYHGSSFEAEMRGRNQKPGEEPSARIKGRRLGPCS